MNKIARWNGSSWSAVNYPSDQTIKALGVDSNGALFVGAEGQCLSILREVPSANAKARSQVSLVPGSNGAAHFSISTNTPTSV